MSDRILDAALSMVARHLGENGVFYANVNFGDNEDGFWQGFPVVWRSEGFYREHCASNGLRMETVGALGELGHVSGNAAQDAQQMLCITLLSGD